MLKERDEISKEMFESLSSKTGINSKADGSIAKAFIDAFGDEMFLLYEFLEEIRRQPYLSTSYGNFLDLIGELVNTKREESETDDEYRYRISQATLVLASGNETAIRETALTVSGVADIELRPYAMGTGSFLIYVYPDMANASKRLLMDVKRAVSNVISEGIYFEVRMPTDIPIGLDIALMFDVDISPMKREDIRNQVKMNIQNYLNKMQKNQTLYINELIKVVMSTDSGIKDMGIVKLTLDSQPKYIVNMFPKDDERFTVGEINVI